MKSIISAIIALIMSIMSVFGYYPDSKKDGGLLFYDDMYYGPNKNQSIDMYLPEDCGSETSLYVCLHSGGWTMGRKEDYDEVIKDYAEKYGIATVTIGYRFLSELSPVNAESIMDDITSGIKLAQKLCAERGVTLTCMALEGGSAGGYNALLYAYEHFDDSPLPIKFVASCVGPTSLNDENNYIGTEIFPTKQAYSLYGSLSGVKITNRTIGTERVQNALKKASPVTYVNENSPITVLLYGDADLIVPYSNAEILKNVLDEFGVENYLYTLKDAGHGRTQFDQETAQYNKEVNSQANEKLDELRRQYLK